MYDPRQSYKTFLIKSELLFGLMCFGDRRYVKWAKTCTTLSIGRSCVAGLAGRDRL